MGSLRINALRVVFFAVVALFFWGCASTTSQPVAESKGMQFSAKERQIIEGFYAESRRGPAKAPTQLYKAGEKLVSGSRPQHLPTALAIRLPDLASSYTRLVVGADVLLVNRDSHDILDVIPSVAY